VPPQPLAVISSTAMRSTQGPLLSPAFALNQGSIFLDEMRERRGNFALSLHQRPHFRLL